jgi:hypothetical protein
MIIEQDLLFTKDECDSIIWDNNQHIVKWDSFDRKYNSHSLTYSAETKWVFDRLTQFFVDKTKIEIRKLKEEIHFHNFKTGDWFGKHNDERENRIYGVGVILNDNFEGGDFKLYINDVVTLEKVSGNAYIFDVKIPHEITPITKGERYSLLWFLQQEHIKLNLTKLI